jgi:hypothetical protein
MIELRQHTRHIIRHETSHNIQDTRHNTKEDKVDKFQDTRYNTRQRAQNRTGTNKLERASRDFVTAGRERIRASLLRAVGWSVRVDKTKDVRHKTQGKRLKTQGTRHTKQERSKATKEEKREEEEKRREKRRK